MGWIPSTCTFSCRIGKVLGFLALFSLLLGCKESSRGITSQAPHLVLKDYGGETVRVDDYTNQVTLLVFWATWCAPCIMEIPALMKLHEKYRDSRFRVISINVDDPEGSKVRSIADQYGINYPLLVGNDDSMKRFGGINSLPTSFIIGTDGKIKEKLQGLYPESILEEKVLAAFN